MRALNLVFHTLQVTGLAWLEGNVRLVSCAKDGYVKVWELATQHCSQTVVGHRCVTPHERIASSHMNCFWATSSQLLSHCSALLRKCDYASLERSLCSAREPMAIKCSHA